jgi:Heparinase II/III-like protein/Heparinase II/III N-terminus
MRLQRLKDMTFTEIAYRSRQEASKWIERVGANGNGEAASPELSKKWLAGDALAELPQEESNLADGARALWERFQRRAPARFFAGACDGETVELLRRDFPDDSARIIATAEKILTGRFDLLGYSGLYFGDPIDWRLDPVAGRRSAAAHWSRIDPLDAASVGDSKVVWELSRHQWLITLGVAYQLAGDEKYPRAGVEYLRQWLRDNPAGTGINWASSLEAALRIISWSWTLFLFRGSQALSPELFVRMLEGVSLHAGRIEKYLSYYFAPNTHLTGEALGLFYAGVLFPELHGAQRWRELGAQILIEECERQILSDGVYFEQSVCYQRYTSEIYLHFLILAERSSVAVPRAVAERVQRLFDVLVSLRRPDGTLPDIGDADGGWLLPLTQRCGGDGRGVLATAAAFFGRSDYACAAAGSAPETLWLLGPAQYKCTRAIQAPPPASRSRSFAEGGYVVMRSGWTRDAHQMIFDVGPLSSPKSGHGHADLLSIQCSAFGEPYLVDAGTYCYTSEPRWREFFRGTAAHSTVTVDGEDQAVSIGPFHWNNYPAARLRRWSSGEDYDFADAEHRAYARLADPVTHRRRVIFVQRRYWLVVDDLSGSAEHRLDFRFQFAPIAIEIEADRWIRARGHEGSGCLLRSFASAPIQMELIEGATEPIQGWISPEYGRRVAAPVLLYSVQLKLPFRMITLLLPVKDSSTPVPDVAPVLSTSFGPAGVTFRGAQETVLIHDSGVVVTGQSGLTRS